MKVVTANRLADGRVVYLGSDGDWVSALTAAQRFSSEEAATVLAKALERKTEIAGAYLVDVDAAAPVGRARLREMIRDRGPTVRPDLGQQPIVESER